PIIVAGDAVTVSVHESDVRARCRQAGAAPLVEFVGGGQRIPRRAFRPQIQGSGVPTAGHPSLPAGSLEQFERRLVRQRTFAVQQDDPVVLDSRRTVSQGTASGGGRAEIVAPRREAESAGSPEGLVTI